MKRKKRLVFMFNMFKFNTFIIFAAKFRYNIILVVTVLSKTANRNRFMSLLRRLQYLFGTIYALMGRRFGKKLYLCNLKKTFK